MQKLYGEKQLDDLYLASEGLDDDEGWGTTILEGLKVADVFYPEFLQSLLPTGADVGRLRASLPFTKKAPSYPGIEELHAGGKVNNRSRENLLKRLLLMSK